jgi:hypothetical protein
MVAVFFPTARGLGHRARNKRRRGEIVGSRTREANKENRARICRFQISAAGGFLHRFPHIDAT